jgi:hypothetical protein
VISRLTAQNGPPSAGFDKLSLEGDESDGPSPTSAGGSTQRRMSRRASGRGEYTGTELLLAVWWALLRENLRQRCHKHQLSIYCAAMNPFLVCGVVKVQRYLWLLLPKAWSPLPVVCTSMPA